MNSSAEDASASDAEGIETYILNNTTDASSRRLAKLENTLFTNTQAENEVDMDIAMILRDLKLDANLGESQRLACAVQSHLVSSTSHRNRGVKQALFHVLLGAEMPSALVEAGFLNNERDRKLVLTPSGRKSLGDAIGRAVVQYRQRSKLSTCKIN
jgi:N-acetylmuramoyl-L-alanine amidase